MVILKLAAKKLLFLKASRSRGQGKGLFQGAGQRGLLLGARGPAPLGKEREKDYFQPLLVSGAGLCPLFGQGKAEEILFSEEIGKRPTSKCRIKFQRITELQRN